MSHIHTWSRWRRPGLIWGAGMTVVIGPGHIELSGTERPAASGWSRTCSTCRDEERS